MESSIERLKTAGLMVVSLVCLVWVAVFGMVALFSYGEWGAALRGATYTSIWVGLVTILGWVFFASMDKLGDMMK